MSGLKNGKDFFPEEFIVPIVRIVGIEFFINGIDDRLVHLLLLVRANVKKKIRTTFWQVTDEKIKMYMQG